MTEGAKPRQLLSVLFILAIAVVFTLNFGPGSKGCEVNGKQPTAQAAATVNGKEIPMVDFNRQFAAQLNYMRSMGSPIPETLARQIGIPKQVMDRLVEAELLAQAAEKHGISVSDDEVRELLWRNPDFQKDGEFDVSTYSQTVRDYYRKTPADYEASLRRSLAAQKLLDIVEGAAVVSDEEIRTRYEKEGNKAQAMAVRFVPSMFAKEVKIDPKELDAYAKAHTKEIADYFDKNKFLYHQAEQVHARHILIKADKDASAEDKKAAKEKAENLRKQIVDEKKDFAEVAKQFSEDPGSKESGGDLGFNEAGAWVPEFSQAAFSLKPGEVSQVVESPFGFHIIKVEEK
ncbi:MAG: SurA N-terminal domain-containing protein [Myxococcaceae bacterium]